MTTTALDTESPRGLLRLVALARDFIDVCREASRDRPPKPSVFDKHVTIADIQFAILSGILLFAFRLLLDNVLIQRMFSSYSEKKQRKLSENIFYTLYYSGASLMFFLYVYPNEPLLRRFRPFTNEKMVYSLFEGYPPPRTEPIHFYYALAMGFYVGAAVFLLAFDSRKSDFAELLIHHVVTIILVVVSFFHRYTYTGALILVLHDVGDILLYGTKIVHYLGLAGLDTALFAVFAVGFYVSRLIVLPRITYAVIVETVREVTVNPGLCSWAMYFETALLHWVGFMVLLFSLVALHCFWFVLILKMIYRELFLQKSISKEGDIREDDDDDDDDD